MATSLQADNERVYLQPNDRKHLVYRFAIDDPAFASFHCQDWVANSFIELMLELDAEGHLAKEP